MKIGSLIKTSLLDYPGKVSAIIGTQGCNMRCPWCHNNYLIPYDFTKNSKIIEEENLIRFLNQRKDFLDGIVITGGEPTIHPDLPNLCELAKEMGYSVKIDTNGTHPIAIKNLLKNNQIDYIAMDIKTDLDQYQRLFREDMDLTHIRKSIEIIMTSEKPYEFRTTCVSPYVSAANIDKIGKLMEGANQLFLQKCHPPDNGHTKTGYEIMQDHDLLELKRRAESYVVSCEIR